MKTAAYLEGKRGLGNIKDISNERFDKLVPVELLRVEKNAIWLMQCDCGELCERPAYVLRRNATRGRTNACDKCVPPGRHPTKISRDERNRRRREREKIHRTASRKSSTTSVRSVIENLNAPTQRRVRRVYVVDGQVMGTIERESDLAWLKRTFRGGSVVEQEVA